MRKNRRPRRNRPHVLFFGQARAHRRNRARASLQAWLEQNPEVARWEEGVVVKAGLLARGQLEKAQALVARPRLLRKYIQTH